MERIAQTNLQLYEQIRAQGRPAGDLALIRRCYELSVTLYSGRFQGDGKPFVAHTIGVASIMAQHGGSSVVVGAACIHNVYGNGDFGDGEWETASPHRRRFVSDAVGEEVEDAIYRFRSLRLNSDTIERIVSGLDRLDARERELLAMDLADHLEKYADRGVLYFGDGSWIESITDKHGATMIDIANRLGYPALAVALADAFEDARSQSIPPELRPDPRHTAIELVMPLSCVRRPGLAR
jgi:hypothetical protein